MLTYVKIYVKFDIFIFKLRLTIHAYFYINVYMPENAPLPSDVSDPATVVVPPGNSISTPFQAVSVSAKDPSPVGRIFKIFLIVLFVLLIIGGPLYYFLVYRQAADNATLHDTKIDSKIMVIEPTSIPTLTPTPEFSMVLASPSDGELAATNDIKVTGKTTPNTTVFIYTDTSDSSVISDDQGNFEGTVTLTDGINSITVAAYSEKDEEKVTTVDVIRDTNT
jgi:hypothetical protein